MKIGDKTITVKTAGGEIEYTNQDIREMIDEIDMYIGADNLPKWIIQSRKNGNINFPKDKKGVLELLKEIENSKNDVYINVDSTIPTFQHHIKMATGGGIENKKKITLHLDSLTDSTYFSSSYGTFRYGYNNIDVVVNMVNKQYGYAKMKGKFAVIDVEVEDIEGNALNKLIFNTKEEAVSYIKNKLTDEDNKFGKGGNMKNTHIMKRGGGFGSSFVPNYPSFSITKGVPHDGNFLSPGYYTYMNKEVYGKGLYMNVNNRQTMGFSIDDLKIIKRNNPDSISVDLSNLENGGKMENGGVIGQEIVFDDNGEENKGVIKDIHEITGNYIVSTDDGRTVLADKERDVISLGAIRKQAEAKKRFSFFEQGGNLDSMSLNQLLDKVPVFERMHIDGYSNYARSKEAFDDLVKEFGNKRYSEEESRQYDNFKKRKVMYENSYKQNVIKYLQRRKMEDGGNIAKENNEMLHSQAKEAKHHIEELHNVLTTKTKVEPWVVAKMTRAKTDLSDITHYLDGNTSKMQNGGKLTDAQQNKFDKVMREWKEGKLHSGSANGPIVKDQDQAIAIAYAQAYGTNKMLFGGMVNDLSDDVIDRMEGLVPMSTLQELLDNAKFIIVDMYEEGFEKDEIMSFLAYKISQIGGGNMMQSVSQVQPWTMEDENALKGWIMDIQDGFGWITPGYVESSWTSRPGSGTKEWNGDIQERVYQRLIDENMLFAENPNDYEKKGKKIKSVTTAIWTAAEENGYEHGGKMQTGGGVEKDSNYYELIRKIENNERVLKNTYGSERVEQVQQEIQRLKDELKNKYGYKYAQGGKMQTGGNIKIGDVYEWHTVEYDSKKGNNYKVVKQVEITDIDNSDVIGRVVGTSNEFIIREPNKYLKKKVSSKMAQGDGVDDKNDKLDNEIFLALLKIYKSQGNSGKDLFSFSEYKLKKVLSEDAFDRLKNGKSPLGKIQLYGGGLGQYYAINIANGDFYERIKMYAEGGSVAYAKMQTGGMVIDKGLEQFKNDEIAEDKDASIHLAQFTGKSIKAQSTDKTWDDGSPVTKYFSRNGFKTINPTGTHYILESDSWWYFKIGKTWYAVKKADYGTPPFEYSHGGKMQTARKISGWKHKSK